MPRANVTNHEPLTTTNLGAVRPAWSSVAGQAQRASVTQDRDRPPSSEAVAQLIAVVHSLSLAKDLDSVMAVVRTAARQFTGADGATFILRDGDRCFYADEDAIGPLWKGQRFPISTCISGWAMTHRSSLCIRDIREDSRISNEAYEPTFVRSLAMVPIRTEDPIGVIGAYWAEIHEPTLSEIQLLQALADSTALALENIRMRAELESRTQQHNEELEAANNKLRTQAHLQRQTEATVHRLSLSDEMTGLNNRRGFLVRAEQLLKLVSRVNTHGWLIYIDIDGLRQVNEQYGQEAGDALIQGAAKMLKESFRDSDILARVAGDEFVVFATGMNAPAVEIEERLRRNIEHYNACFPNLAPLSMSFGVIRCDPHSLHSLDDMIHQADAAMYIEKRRKRVQQQS